MKRASAPALPRRVALPERVYFTATGAEHAALGGCRHRHRTPENAVLCGQARRFAQVWSWDGSPDASYECEILLPRSTCLI